MTLDSLLSILLAVVIPFLLAVAGGVLAVKALPNAKSLEKRWWIALFVVLPLVGFALSIFQQVRATSAQAKADQAQSAEKLRLEGINKYTQGQLDSINKGLTEVVQQQGDSKDYKSAVLALLSMTAPKQTVTEAPVTSAHVGVNGLSSLELANRAFELAATMRAIQQQYDKETGPRHSGDRRYNPNGTESQAVFDARQALLDAAFRSERKSWDPHVQELRDIVKELRLRVPTDQLPRQQDRLSAMNGVLSGAGVAGGNLFVDASYYLEELASTLTHPAIAGK